ncbi:unnamed protein product [Protopolystoma xenopodis]|uniref:Uncharacterized protein n=1 Tax=Protopolystoma xenopodis TaxID=117903 RepID=A0A3S5A130_9PLAT|nr:unnamed protein product [Protopolystoma xenopodis]
MDVLASITEMLDNDTSACMIPDDSSADGENTELGYTEVAEDACRDQETEHDDGEDEVATEAQGSDEDIEEETQEEEEDAGWLDDITVDSVPQQTLSTSRIAVVSSAETHYSRFIASLSDDCLSARRDKSVRTNRLHPADSAGAIATLSPFDYSPEIHQLTTTSSFGQMALSIVSVTTCSGFPSVATATDLPSKSCSKHEARDEDQESGGNIRLNEKRVGEEDLEAEEKEEEEENLIEVCAIRDRPSDREDRAGRDISDFRYFVHKNKRKTEDAGEESLVETVSAPVKPPTDLYWQGVGHCGKLRPRRDQLEPSQSLEESGVSLAFSSTTSTALINSVPLMASALAIRRPGLTEMSPVVGIRGQDEDSNEKDSTICPVEAASSVITMTSPGFAKCYAEPSYATLQGDGISQLEDGKALFPVVLTVFLTFIFIS